VLKVGPVLDPAPIVGSSPCVRPGATSSTPSPCPLPTRSTHSIQRLWFACPKSGSTRLPRPSNSGVGPSCTSTRWLGRWPSTTCARTSTRTIFDC
jgi:hypothetical protein